MKNDETSEAGALERALDRALGTGSEAVGDHVENARRRRPGASPKDIQDSLEAGFLVAVALSGGAAGAAAAAPGVGVPAGLAAGGLDAAAFLGASTMLVLASAQVHGVPVDDLERRKALVLTVLLGNAGAGVVNTVAERAGGHLGRQIARNVPIEAIRSVNRILGRNFVTRYGTRQGVLVLGKAMPFGIGALIGAGGNLLFGKMIVRALRDTLGPAPTTWRIEAVARRPRAVDGFGGGVPSAA